MDRDQIADEIARRDLYRRSDGDHSPSDQLRLRARKYQHLFECIDSRCSRIRLRGEGGGSDVSSVTRPRRKNRSAQDTGRVRSLSLSPEIPGPRAWYEDLRQRYRPKRLRYLLIAESPPDPGAGEMRFFYSPKLTFDNLYRGVAQAVYGKREDIDLRDKPAVLERLRKDGFWLIDAVEEPVDKLTNSARNRMIEGGVPGLVRKCKQLSPECGVIICHNRVYGAAAAALRSSGVRILHEEALPFPLGNWRVRFVEGFRRALNI